MNGRDHDVYEEEMKDIRGHHQPYLQQQPYHQDQQYHQNQPYHQDQQYHQNQPYLQNHHDPHAISTDNLMMPERLSAIASPRGRRPAYPGAHDSMSSAYGWNAESIPATPADSRSTTPTFSPYNNDFNNSRSYLSTTTLVNKNPHNNSGHLSTSTFPSKHSLGEDSITRLNERDDVELSKGWRRFIFKFVPFLALTNTALYLTYLGLRIACVILAQRKFGITYPGAWVFLGVEIVVAIPSQMHNFWTMWALKKRNRPQLRLNSEEVPGVDVFVTCCGEDDDVVLDTVRAACDLDYPRDRYRVVVLDDGKAASLEESVNQLGYVYPNLYYMARTKVKGVPHHFKAGNLNYGLEQLDLLPGGANEFMAALDADMIPEPSWLRAMLPHMVLDPKLALACPPQLFYNTPVSDPLAQSLNFFVHVIEPIKDALGVAWCTGSGYVIRREALTEIGNFPLGSLAEDVATSTLMLGRGWKTAYIHEPLQFGTVPEDYGGHLKQRTRWAIGTIQTAFKLNFCLFGKDVKMMTGAQRFSGALYAILGMFTILVTISLFAIPVVLVWGKPLIAYADLEQLRWLIRACFAAFMCNRFCEFALFSPAGYHTGQRDSRYQLWMSPYISLSIIRSFILPKWLGGSIVAFKPTGSLGNALNERDPANKKNMFRRIWAILFNYMAVFHFVFVYFTLVAVVLTSYRVFFPEGQSVRDIFIGLITHAFWPPLTFLFLCSSLWTPVSYAIDPPQMPEREELLVRDQKTGVAHPTTASKKVAFGGQAAWFEFLYTGSTIYTGLVFAYSFFL